MIKNQSIRELFEQERPYEKFMSFGASALTDAELLAIILRSGTKGVSSLELAGRILSEARIESGLSGLFHMSLKQLEIFPGIGRVKAIQLKCICEISKRIARSSAAKVLQFNDPSSIAEFYMEKLRHEEQEHVYCMMLDGRNSFLGDECITKGTVNCSLVTPREVFLKAFSHHAVSIILIHNHPSGNPVPSKDDIDITQRIYNAGELIGIQLLDHIVIGGNSYASIIAEGRLINQ